MVVVLLLLQIRLYEGEVQSGVLQQRGEQDGLDSALWSEELLCEGSGCEGCGSGEW